MVMYIYGFNTYYIFIYVEKGHKYHSNVSFSQINKHRMIKSELLSKT